MAKGNMLQGMARGKVGDVVFSRLNGEQISRVRNRHPNNPRTNPQVMQRAIMATIMQAYAAGKAIFDHSFQGKKTGSGCQREFMSINAKMLREAVAYDINNDLKEGNVTARCVIPGATTPVPNAYIISRGGYVQNFFEFSSGAFHLKQVNSNESCAAFCARTGLVPGDLYTIVAITNPNGEETDSWAQAHSAQKPGTFHFVRLQVKDSALEDQTVIAGTMAALTETAGAPFVITERYNSTVSIIVADPDDAMSISELGFGASQGAYGIIRSRLDQDLRSDSVMHVVSESTAVKSTGLANPFILSVWQAGTTKLGDSDLILEGGNF